MKNVVKPLAKGVLIPLELTAAASIADTRICKKVLGLGIRPGMLVSHPSDLPK